MKEFKKFVNSGKSKPQDISEKVKECAQKLNISEEVVKDLDIDSENADIVKSLTEKYKDNQELLIGDILKLADKNKSEGRLDLEQLSDFEQKISPILNGKQKKMLDNIMNMIKNKK